MATRAPAPCLESTEFVPLNDLLVASDQVDRLVPSGLDSLDALFDPARGELLSKPGLSPWRQRVRVRLEGGGAPETVYIKRYENPPLAARREARKSGTGSTTVAGVEWSWLRRLRRAGIPCPAPIALGEQNERGRERRSAIVIGAAPGVSLERWVTVTAPERTTATRTVLTAVAGLVRRFHAAGWVHRDLYLSHLMYDDSASPDEPLHLIDVQRVLQPTTRQRRWIVKDLAALNHSTPQDVASRTDRLRWLKIYLGVSRLNADGRRLLYRVVGKTRSIARRDRRRRLRNQRDARSSQR